MPVDDLFTRLAGAYAENTLRAYRADFSRFHDWCTSQRLDPLALAEEDFVRYVDFLSLTRRSATVRRQVASISAVLRLSEAADVTRRAGVVLAMRRMYRQKGRAQAQALPLTADILEQLLGVCDDSMQGLRDQLLLRLGYETMRRRAELCAFRFEDLETLPNGRAALRLRYSKSDQYGVGKLIPISPTLLALIERWGLLVGSHGYLLRRLHRSGAIGSDLAPASVNRRLQALQAAAGIELDGQLSGHSFRVGRALDLLEGGESLEKIMLRGGWEAESTVIRYLRAWQAASC